MHATRIPSALFVVILVFGAQASDAPEGAAHVVLDDFHAAASEADEERFFGHFAPDGVFLGTDATERWTVEEFREYAHPHFSTGRGWTYVPTERHVVLSGDAGMAWFDEILLSEKYGTIRGTGVLKKIDGKWKIVHYSMSFLVPNEVTAEVVTVIRNKTP